MIQIQTEPRELKQYFSAIEVMISEHNIESPSRKNVIKTLFSYSDLPDEIS